MKKQFISKKIKLIMFSIFISSLICYISAFILLFNSGYSFSKFYNHLRVINLSSIKLYFIKNSLDFSLNQSTSLNEYALNDSIDSIYFNIASQDIELQSYDGDVLQVKVKSSKFLNNDDLITSQDDSTLIFSSSNTMDSKAHIIVNIPNYILTNHDIYVNTSNGNIFACNIYTDSLNLSSYSGYIYLSDSSANYLNLKNFNGDINAINNTISIESKFSLNSGYLAASGDLGLLTANNMSGDIALDLKQISKDISLTCVSGNINLLVPENSNYKTDYSSLHGKLRCSQSLLVQGNESNNLSITTTSGDTFIGYN